MQRVEGGIGVRKNRSHRVEDRTGITWKDSWVRGIEGGRGGSRSRIDVGSVSICGSRALRREVSAARCSSPGIIFVTIWP
jgi:hypothetical protein